MSDLDDDLLALADGMDIENDDDDDYGFLEKNNGGNGEQQSNELKYPFPYEKFYLDEDDKDRILSLPELEQEEIMYEREQKIKEYKEREYFLNRKKEQERSKGRVQQYDEDSEEEDEDDDYQAKPNRANRLKKLVNKSSSTPSDEDYVMEEDSEEDEDDDYVSKVRTSSKKTQSQDVEWDEETYTSKYPELKDYNNIKIGRQFVDKFCFYPGFNKQVVGCYGRVNVSTSSKHTQYRLVKIEKVFIQKPYKFGNSFFTNQYFGVTQGKFRKIFQMNFFSDSDITEQELTKYNNYLKQQNIKEAKKQELKAKFNDLQEFSNQPLTNELMNQQVANRLQLNKKLSGVNSVIEKSILKDKLQYAVDTNNENDINKYSKQLKQLEKRMNNYDKHHENDLEGSTKLNFLTQKNKKINIENIKTKKQEDTEIKNIMDMKDKKSDPFSRLKTKARIYYKDLQKIENEKYLQEQEEKKKEKLKKATQEREEREYMEMIKSKFKKRGGFEFLVKDIRVDIDLDL